VTRCRASRRPARLGQVAAAISAGMMTLPEIAAQLAYPDERGLVDTAGRLLAETA